MFDHDQPTSALGMFVPQNIKIYYIYSETVNTELNSECYYTLFSLNNTLPFSKARRSEGVFIETSYISVFNYTQAADIALSVTVYH